jgi:nitrate/TMAO reductase-like tetraheme cytochrome c subunit
VGGIYDGLSTACVDCHQNDYDDTGDPDHAEAGFGTTCNNCHTTSNWDANYDHSLTGFPLTGAHLNRNCSECHTGGLYSNQSSACFACHETQFNNADNPDHTGYPTTCGQCHSTISWDGATFDHSTTDFPLTGAHVSLACASCHVGGQYTETSTDCYACHSDDYDNTDDPDHAAMGFPQNCEACHNTTTWDDADFDHSTSGFPLTGAHVNASCADCHIGGQYSGTPADCYFCHESNYDNANSPNHSAGYPLACDDCHTTSNWNSSFNHDSQYFPIYSGEHRGEWDLCIECHIVSGNFTVFSCIDCHEHSNQNEVNSDHNGVGGYSYTPTSCYNCHEDGSDRRLEPFMPNPFEKLRAKGGSKR